MADPPGSKEPQLSWLPTYDPMSVGLGYMPEEDIRTAHELRPYITEIGKQGTISSMPFGISTAYNWNNMGKWGRAASIGFDVLDIATFPGTMSPLRAGFNQFARNWSPSFRNPFRQTPDTSFVRFGKLPGDDIQQAFGPTQHTSEIFPYRAKPSIGQAYPPMGQKLPIPQNVRYSSNWGQAQDPDLPKYLYEQGVSSYQMIPYKSKLNPATKWLVRNPQTLDPADPIVGSRAFDPRYGSAEKFQKEFSRMGQIEDLSDWGMKESETPIGQMFNRGTYNITGKPVSQLGADFEQLIDPTQISSYQRIPHESLTFASPEFSKEMFKGFDAFGNPIGNRPLASVADINIPWVTPGTMPVRSSMNKNQTPSQKPRRSDPRPRQRRRNVVTND